MKKYGRPSGTKLYIIIYSLIEYFYINYEYNIIITHDWICFYLDIIFYIMLYYNIGTLKKICISERMVWRLPISVSYEF